MANYLVADGFLVWPVLWQTTLLLLLGLAASWLWARQPARAHCLLMLTMLGALLTPCASVVARHMGWGLWAASPRLDPPAQNAAIPASDAEGTVLGVAGPMQVETTYDISAANLTLTSTPASLDQLVIQRSDKPKGKEIPPASTVPWSGWFAWLWIALTAILAGRLVLAVGRGWRLLASARPLVDAHLAEALKEALSQLGLRRAAVIYTSQRVAGPVIWCWARRPIVLVPAGSLRAGVDWSSILCHELAHWKRCDHLTSLVGEMLVALLPVQPLSWWARRRLALLCERACDDWVVAMGRSPIQYAESLLHLLTAQTSSQAACHGVALAAVSGKASLQRRIRHILDSRRVQPAVSRRWLSFALLSMSTLVAVLALAQQRPAAAQAPEQKSPIIVNIEADGPRMTLRTQKPPDKGKEGQTITVAGKVLGPDKKPAPEASVVLVSGDHVSATAKADKEGKFRIQGTAAPANQAHFVFAWAPGFAPVWQIVKAEPKPGEVTLHLAEGQILRGRLIDLQGQPAAGVKLAIRRLGAGLPPNQSVYFFRTATDIEEDPEGTDKSVISIDATIGNAVDANQPGMMAARTAQDQAGALPPIQVEGPSNPLPGWPEAVTTDQDGRFVLKGIPRGQGVRLLLRDERYAMQTLDIKGQNKNEPDAVTLAVAPPHVIEGVVTDADTGKPIPGARVRVPAPGSFGGEFSLGGSDLDFKGRPGMVASLGLAFLIEQNYSGHSLPGIETRADEAGRFRLSLFSADNYTLSVKGPEGQPYLRTTTGVNWPKGSVHKEANIPLVRGTLVRGKVVEEPGGKPVAGARIDFFAKDLKVPQGARYAHHVQSGPDGVFQAILPRGKWHALANAPTSVYLWHKIPASELIPGEPAKGSAADSNQASAAPQPVQPPKYYYPDAWAAFDLQSDTPAVDLSLSFQRRSLLGQVVGADGKPVTGAVMQMRRMVPAGGAAGRGGQQVPVAPVPVPPPPAVLPVADPGKAGDNQRQLDAPAAEKTQSLAFVTDLAFDVSGTEPSAHSTERVPLPDGKFEIPVNDPEATIRVLFQDPVHEMGAVVDLKGKQAEGGPVTVRLVSCGSARARFVDAKGKPLAGYRPAAWAMLPPIHPPQMTELGNMGPQGPESSACEIWLGRSDPKHYGDGPRTDAEGWVVLPDLVPGVVYRISQFNAKAKDFTVEAGKLTQVGDIVIAKPDESKKLPSIQTK